MARLARVVLPDHPHHVTLRGNNRRTLFSYPRDYQHFIYELGRAQDFSPCELYAAMLMTNHVHLVVRPKDAATLARFVKHVSQRYAQARNARRGATGRLFDARYHSTPIKDEEQLARTLAYVELNPVRAGMVTHAEHYRWSTYACHASLGRTRFPRALWTPSPWYLSLASTDEARVHAYARWVDHSRDNHVRPGELSPTDARSALRELTSSTRVRRPDETRAA